MQIDHCLILSAGFGTRMGEIGKTLPKILWPLFEKTLLELQIEYAQSWGCKHIYINSHFLYQKVFQSFQKLSPKNASLVHEPILLGSGGSIYNIAGLSHVNKKGVLLVMNGDQFFFPSERSILLAMEKIKKHPVVLFSVEVEGKYGEVVTQDDFLVEIVGSSSPKKCITYSGMGLVNLEELDNIPGVSSFFTSVADYKSQKIPMLFGENEYWDFGTIERYYHSVFALLKKVIQKEQGPFVDFFLEKRGLIMDKVNNKKNSYNHDSANTVNLSAFPVQNHDDCHAIVLSLEKSREIKTPGIYCDNLVEKMEFS